MAYLRKYGDERVVGGGEFVRGGREREPLPLGLSLEQAALVYPACCSGPGLFTPVGEEVFWAYLWTLASWRR